MTTQERQTIQCGSHGQAYATYLCSHLARKPVQRWFSSMPEEDNPWPDAWCGKCNAAYEREGGWNSRNEGELPLSILCDGCYTHKRSSSVGHLKGRALAKWERFTASCCEEVSAKQRAMNERFALGEHERWDWDGDKGELVFSSAGVPKVVARCELVGSFSTASDTWLWGWDNFSYPKAVRRRIPRVHQWGESGNFPHLTTPRWAATEHDGWHMAMIAAHVLGAIGVYRMPHDNGAVFVAVMSARRPRGVVASQDSHRTRRLG